MVDERTLRELYLCPSRSPSGKGGALAVMTAYNRLNGSWLTEQPELLQGILRGEWGFEGLVMTDWFAVGRHRSSPPARARPRDARTGPGVRLGAR